MNFEAFANLGLSVIPIRPDGSKRPAVEWAKYQQSIATKKEMKSWAGSYMGIVCGKVSGGLECIDIDCKYDLTGNLLAKWSEIVESMKPGLLKKLVIQKTMNHGYHAIYRCNEIDGNLKLARRLTTDDERKHPNDKFRVLIETRGEGGYILIDPTPGYRLIRNDMNTIPLMGSDERKCLLMASKALDGTGVSLSPRSDEITPLDAFCEQSSDSDVVGLLEKHGWRVVKHRNGTYYLIRPGKNGDCISATYGHIGKMFYCFSTSTAFESEKGYTPAGVYAVLEHNGDYNAAAKELSRRGYGSGQIIVPQKEVKIVKSFPSNVVTANDCMDDLKQIINGTFGRGLGTGWGSLDKYYTVSKGQLNVVTGYPSHGKSEWVDALSINLATNHGWNWLVFSPENYPVAIHIEKLIEKKLGKGIRDAKIDLILKDIIQWISERYYFFDSTDDIMSLDSILETAEEVITAKAIDGFIIDPWNEIDACRPSSQSETDFIGHSLMRIRKFSRRLRIATFIVAHPTKTRKNDAGKYPTPTLYDISGSANWRNKADNGIVIYALDDGLVEIEIQKVKYKYHGKPGKICLQWNSKNGTYSEEIREDWRTEW